MIRLRNLFGLVFLILNSGTVIAQAITFPEACWEQVDQKNYLVRGERTATRPGARLWNLERLQRAWSRGDADDCTRAIYTQALNDQAEYWHYIGVKYGCIAAAPAPPAADTAAPDVAAPTVARHPVKCQMYKDNSDYLRFSGFVSSQDKGVGMACINEEFHSRGFNEVNALAANVSPIMGAVLNGEAGGQPEPLPDGAGEGGAVAPGSGGAVAPGTAPTAETPASADPEALPVDISADACSHVPVALRRESAKARGWVAFSAVCGYEVIRGSLTHLWDLIKSSWNLVRHPFAAASGLATLVRELTLHPVQTSMNILKGVYEYFGEEWTDMACFNSQHQCRQMGSFITKLVSSVYIGKLAGIVVAKGARTVKGLIGAAVRSSPTLTSAAGAITRQGLRVKRVASAVRHPIKTIARRIQVRRTARGIADGTIPPPGTSLVVIPKPPVPKPKLQKTRRLIGGAVIASGPAGLRRRREQAAANGNTGAPVCIPQGTAPRLLNGVTYDCAGYPVDQALCRISNGTRIAPEPQCAGTEPPATTPAVPPAEDPAQPPVTPPTSGLPTPRCEPPPQMAQDEADGRLWSTPDETGQPIGPDFCPVPAGAPHIPYPMAPAAGTGGEAVEHIELGGRGGNGTVR